MTFGNSIFRKLFWIVLLQFAAAFLLLGLYLARYSAITVTPWRILSISAVAASIALIVAYFFSRSVTRRISRLREFAERLVEPRSSKRTPPGGGDQIGALARSLYGMADRLHDVVERLSLESARRQAVLFSMVEGVLTVDIDFRVTFYNDSFRRLVGLSAPMTEPVPLLELVRDSGLMEMLRQAIASQQPLNRRLLLPAAEGRVFEVHAAPLDGSLQRGAVAILHDITDLERLERVRKDFVANVSHELRTPLTAICGYAEALLEGALEDRENNRKFVEIIKTHANRLNSIASDLLILSELESTQRPAEPDRISVQKSLEAALHAIEPEAKARKINLVCDRIEEAEVMGYKVHFEQAILNLLQNAIKFNRAGGEVRLRADRTEDGKIYIAIADTGLGIPSEDLSRIFERFYRVDKARSREVGGTGLGLSIVKHVIERMNGAVTVESQLGKGSKFTVMLPCS